MSQASRKKRCDETALGEIGIATRWAPRRRREIGYFMQSQAVLLLLAHTACAEGFTARADRATARYPAPRQHTHHSSNANLHLTLTLRGGDDSTWLEKFTTLPTYTEHALAVGVLWGASALLYLLTLYWCDQQADLLPEQRPLHDFGFAAVPVRRGMSCATDVSGSLLALWTAMKFFVGSLAEQREARYTVFCVAIGNFFSATLHTVTLMPAVPVYTDSTGLPLMGGRSDKLMSNHTFCVGLVLQMLARLGYCHHAVFLLGVPAYSVMMLSSRAHYSVDIVLSWWALAVAHAHAPLS